MVFAGTAVLGFFESLNPLEVHTEFEKLQDKYSELEVRNCYMKDFIDYMKMGDKFFEFVEKTHVETNEFVFRYYTL